MYREALENCASVRIGQLVKPKSDAVDFQLYLSQTGPRGSVYTKLASWPLEAAVVSRTRVSRT